jgi:hypothetical protein
MRTEEGMILERPRTLVNSSADKVSRSLPHWAGNGEQRSFVGLDQTIHQFHRREGAGKLIVQVDCVFFAHLPVAFGYYLLTERLHTGDKPVQVIASSL